MSTPSPTPLDFEFESPYAPKWAREQAQSETAAMADAAREAADAPQLAPGAETERDSKILSEIESSLREMLDVANGRATEIVRLSEVSKAASELLAQDVHNQPAQPLQAEEAPQETLPDDHAAPNLAYDEREAAPRDAGPFAQHYAAMDRESADHGSYVARGETAPPWRLPRSLEPETVPEPWPRPRSRKRNGAMSYVVRFGLATTGAAALAALVVNDVPSSLYRSLRGPLSELSTNASAAFDAGKAPSMQTKLEAMARRQEPSPAPAPAPAPQQIASAAPVQQEISAAAKSDHPTRSAAETTTRVAARAAPAEAPRETVMSAWPTPPAAAPTPSRPEPIWHGPASRSEPAKPAQRTMTAEETAMLRKLGNDYVAAGDFAGARVVYERAAEGGDAQAALSLAETYDPVVLARSKVRGLQPDVVKAGFWYERARELGSSEAPRRLQAMAGRNE